jgi:Phage stabilisation protein
MAGKSYVQCIGPSYHLADKKSAVQSAVNCFPKKLDGDVWMMASTPGEVDIAALTGEVRGSRNVDGRWFMVAGSTLYEMAANGTYIVRGSLGGSSGFVGMSHNKTQLALVDGASLYVFALKTNVLTIVSSAGWRGSDDVHELDGYFIFVDPETDQFYISAIDDGTSLDALDFSSADSSPDNIVTHRVSHRQVWFFGTRSTEIWIDSGALSFPFVRYNSYTLDVGCVGKRAAINAADTLFWIGQTDRGTGIVYMAVGNQPQRVSTLAIEEALKASTDIASATLWTYQIEGHEFIGINAPGLETTWVYDAAMQQWHERAEWDSGWKPLRSRLVTAFANEHFAGDSSGKVVRLDAGLNNLSGRVLVRERTWPHMMQPSMEPISFHGLELAMKSGSGGNVTLEISNDGGITFGPKLLRSLGAIGRWMQRIRWLGLGAAVNRVFRIRCSDDVPFAIHSAAVDT